MVKACDVAGCYCKLFGCLVEATVVVIYIDDDGTALPQVVA